MLYLFGGVNYTVIFYIRFKSPSNWKINMYLKSLAGVPAMALEYAMKQNGIIPKTDANMVTNIDFAATAGAFGRYIK